MVAQRKSKQLTKRKTALESSQPKNITKLITRCARKKSVQTSEEESLSTDDNTDSTNVSSDSIGTQSCDTEETTRHNDISVQDDTTSKSLMGKVVRPKKVKSKTKPIAKGRQTQLNKIIVSEENINKEDTEQCFIFDKDKATIQSNSKSNLLIDFDNHNTPTVTNTVTIQQCTNINNVISDKFLNEEDDESSGASLIYHSLEYNDNTERTCKHNEQIVIDQLPDTKTHILLTEEEGIKLLKACEKYKTQCYDWISAMSKAIKKNKSLRYLIKKYNMKVETVRGTALQEFRLIDENNNVLLDAAGQCKTACKKRAYFAARELVQHYKLEKNQVIRIENALDTTFRREYLILENDCNTIKISRIKK